jgi:SAM-dependent methyltransferase
VTETNQPDIKLIEIPCPLCDSRDSTPLCKIQDVTYGIVGRFDVVRCKHCRHIFLNPRPADESLMDCYPQSYSPHTGVSNIVQPALVESDADRPVQGGYESTTAEPSSASWQDQTAIPVEESTADNLSEDKSSLRKFLRRLPGLRRFLYWLGQEQATWLPAPPQAGQSRMLEIGCAHGGFLEDAQHLQWIVDGIEPSPAAVKIARKKGLQVHCGDLFSAGIPEQSREFVAMWMVLEHVPNPRQLLAEVAAVLVPHGCLAISVPNAGSWERWFFGQYWLGYDAPRHLQMFRISQLKKLLNELGFEQVRVIHQSNTRYWWGSIAAWGKLNFPNHRWPERWMEYFRGEPPRSWKWALLVPGKLAALVHNAGRVTIIATRSKLD